MSASVERLRDARILVVNWRDVCHPLAGGAEQYMHEIGRRWVRAGAAVTWLAAAVPGRPTQERLDGMRVLRAGGPLSVYARTAVRLLQTRGHFDAVVDCQNGIPFYAPLFAGAEMPVVQVVHHVHQDQFATRFSAPMAAVGRLMEGPLACRVYADRPIAAVSPSTRSELRRRLGFTGPVYVVPNGTVLPARVDGRRTTAPTVVLVSRLVPHKRIDLLLGHLATIATRIPGLRVEVAGDGPDRSRLQGLAADLGLQSTVRFHGRVPDEVRDLLLEHAWLTVSTSAAEGWGCSVIEAAAWGVPCLALEAPGIRDSVLDQETGWLVEQPADLGSALVAAIGQLADSERARVMARACRDWAACFSWDRSADLLAGVVLQEMGRVAARRRSRELNRRSARSDMAVVARVRDVDADVVPTALRVTDEVVGDGDLTSVVLTGCDEFDAPAVLDRIGARVLSLRLVDRRQLLAGPTVSRPPLADATDVGTRGST
ncbi:glycosyltransferase family 4 protein [Modestobacter sp. I12A-02662]|uniref:glycosyltransferase family 4 protein n=1 Tax=Modestobacter sp. I12A-02662 TaxID=1730496 RepID=UPI0034DE16D5